MPGVEWRLHRPEPANPEFRKAVDALRSQNDAHLLIDYLKSDRPLGESEREVLANLIERPTKPHRPANHDLRFAAMLASEIYREWRDKAPDWRGHAEEMREAIARFVAETFFFEMDICAILDLMSRPKSRRGFGAVGAEITLKPSRRK